MFRLPEQVPDGVKLRVLVCYQDPVRGCVWRGGGGWDGGTVHRFDARSLRIGETAETVSPFTQARDAGNVVCPQLGPLPREPWERDNGDSRPRIPGDGGGAQH